VTQMSVSSALLERISLVAGINVVCTNVTTIMAPQISNALLPTTGSFELSVFASKFTTHDISMKVRLETAATTTVWQSDSTCRAKSPSSYRHAIGLVTSLVQSIFVQSEVTIQVSAQSVIDRRPAIIPVTGSLNIFLTGSNFATFSSSITVKFHQTMNSSTLWWISDSIIFARTPVITNLYSSIEFVFMHLILNTTVAPPAVLNISHFTLPATAFIIINAFGVNFVGNSPAFRISSSSCQSTNWLADSAVSCKASSFSSDAHSITVSHHKDSIALSRHNVTLLIGSAAVKSINPQAGATTSSHKISILAVGLGSIKKSVLLMLEKSYVLEPYGHLIPLFKATLHLVSDAMFHFTYLSRIQRYQDSTCPSLTGSNQMCQH
jgi:hypothetical protein